MAKALTSLVLSCSILSCLTRCGDAFEYSPYQIFDNGSPKNLNAKNLSLLDSLPKDDTVVIAFVGDSQRFYDELDNFINVANSISAIDFILLAGDISDFGLLEEFKLIDQKLSRLKKPHIAVVGNHDLVSRGEQVFENIFGPLNFSFEYQNIKFIAHNTNSIEYETGNVPDIQWLQAQLGNMKEGNHVIAVSHMPPFSTEFDKNLEGPYVSLFEETPGFLLSLHGHIHEHKDFYPYGDGIRYMTSFSFDQKSFVLLKIVGGEIEKHIIDY